MKFEFNWANGLWENYVLIYSEKQLKDILIQSHL